MAEGKSPDFIYETLIGMVSNLLTMIILGKNRQTSEMKMGLIK